MASLYEIKKDYKKALECYEKYLSIGRPGTAGFDFAESGAARANQELFMGE